jgi:hypothetical protein
MTQRREKLTSTGIRTFTPSAIQPVTRRYTDCAIPAPTKTQAKKCVLKKKVFCPSISIRTPYG